MIKKLSYKQVKENLKQSPYNRDINDRHVAECLAGMISNPELIPPIIVSKETDHIIEGLHRNIAFLLGIERGVLPASLKLDVKYISCPPEKELEMIRECNRHTRKYRGNDYVTMHIKAGSESIKALDEWCAKRELCVDSRFTENRVMHSVGTAFLTGKDHREALIAGTFTLTDDDIEFGTMLYDEVNELRKILGWPSTACSYDIFAKVWRDMRGMHDFDTWKKAFAKHAPLLKSMRRPSNKAEYVAFLTRMGDSVRGKSAKTTKAAAKTAAKPRKRAAAKTSAKTTKTK